MIAEPPIVGILTPPDWYDPTGDEFRTICLDPIRLQQAFVTRPGLDYDDLSNIAGAAPDVAQSAQILGGAGASAIGMTGTPFVWAGLSSRKDIERRHALFSDAAGCPVIMAGTAIVDALRTAGAHRIAIATPYYTAPWRAQTRQAFEAFGFEVGSIASLDALDEVGRISSISDHGAFSGMEAVTALLHHLNDQSTDLDALVLAGAGVRMLNATPALEAELGCPLVSSDTALYFGLAKILGLRLKPGVLGKMNDLLL